MNASLGDDEGGDGDGDLELLPSMSAKRVTPSSGRAQDLQQSLTAQEDWGRHQRIVRVMLLFCLFWMAMLFFFDQHDDVLFVSGCTLFALWLLYMVSSIVHHLFFVNWFHSPLVAPLPGRRESVRTDGVLSTTDADTGDEIVDHRDDDWEHGDASFPRNFARTRDRILRNAGFVPSGDALTSHRRHPTSGTYRVVYAAVVYTRPLRFEGKLQLRFVPMQNHDCWSVEGRSIFASSTTSYIAEGLVNARGEMYWRTEAGLPTGDEADGSVAVLRRDRDDVKEHGDTKTTILVENHAPKGHREGSWFRGVLNFETSCLVDGEFEQESSKGSGSNEPLVGRIVRLELMEASLHGRDEELV